MTDEFFQKSEEELGVITRAYPYSLTEAKFRDLCQKITRLDFKKEEEFRKAMFDYLVHTRGKKFKYPIGLQSGEPEKNTGDILNKIIKFSPLISLLGLHFTERYNIVGSFAIDNYRKKILGQVGT